MVASSLGSLPKLWQAWRCQYSAGLQLTGESSEDDEVCCTLVMTLRQSRDSHLHDIRTSRIAAAAGMAAGTAAAVERVEELMHRATASFRCVRMDRITEEAFSTAAGPTITPCELSEAANFGEVDAFVSHSWNDSPTAKWQALQVWRREFIEIHGREPRVWIDKYCIDQSRIAEHLEMLPIFLAGCTKLVVLAGATYHQRLWCLAELFTFIVVGGQEGEVSLLPLPGDQSDWGAVDVQMAACASPVDRQRLLRMMEAETGAQRLTQGIKSLFQGHVAWLEEPPRVHCCQAMQFPDWRSDSKDSFSSALSSDQPAGPLWMSL